jgi:TPR repeat protein
MGLGAAYYHGNQGAPKDLANAKHFLQKACDLDREKLADACEVAGTL